MTSKPRIAASVVVILFAFALPFTGGGCTKQACFFWTEAEVACPSQDEAINFFGDQGCSSPIESVDSEAEFDGELCCYDVTETDTSDAPPCATGAGGFGSGVAMAAVSTTGPSCQTCSSLATSAFMGAIPMGMCPTSQTIFDEMITCVCSGACQAMCNADVACTGQTSTMPCFECATDSSVGCGNQFSNCVNDL